MYVLLYILSLCQQNQKHMAHKISSFRFSVDGLRIQSTNGLTTSTLTLAPCATCDLLKDAGAIEDFTTDGNGEPVILYSDSSEPQGYGYEPWYRFVTTFAFTHRHAEILLEHKEQRKAFRRTQAIIVQLLSPLAA